MSIKTSDHAHKLPECVREQIRAIDFLTIYNTSGVIHWTL